jgi:N-acetylneuraminate synthase
VNIDGIKIGPGHPPFIVAEVAGEHRQSMERLTMLCHAAKEAGADAIKLQLYDPDRLAAARGGADKVLTDGLWKGWSLGDLYRAAHTPREWFDVLPIGQFGIPIFASVFHEEDVEFLDALSVPAFKISSFELTDIALIRKAASTGKPVILSTGMASNDDIQRALASMLRPEEPSVVRVGDCALLHCVSAYPCNMADANLWRVGEMRSARPHLPIGLSDHTAPEHGSLAAVVATALGASIIEKHITLDRKNGGPDAPFSLEPAEFKQMVQDVKDAYASLGTGGRPESENIYRELRRKG